MESYRFCGCKGLWKACIIKEKQRYRCKNCNKNQAEIDSRAKYSDEERKYVLVLYIDGDGFRRIARIMSKIYRYQTVINRIQKAGLKVLKENSTVKMTELRMYIKTGEKHEFGRR